jgi:hypothetical protein
MPPRDDLPGSLRELLDERGPSLEEIVAERDRTRKHMTMHVEDERRGARKKKPGKILFESKPSRRLA